MTLEGSEQSFSRAEPWECLTCGYTGIVNVLADAPALVAWSRICEAHAEASPDCPKRNIARRD